MVLFDTLTTRDGAEHQMAGLLPGKVMMGQRLAAIGLQSLALPEGELRGHTFHYSRLETLSTPYLVAFPTATVRSSMSITRVRLPHPTCTPTFPPIPGLSPLCFAGDIRAPQFWFVDTLSIETPHPASEWRDSVLSSGRKAGGVTSKKSFLLWGDRGFESSYSTSESGARRGGETRPSNCELVGGATLSITRRLGFGTDACQGRPGAPGIYSANTATAPPGAGARPDPPSPISTVLPAGIPTSPCRSGTPVPSTTASVLIADRTTSDHLYLQAAGPTPRSEAALMPPESKASIMCGMYYCEGPSRRSSSGPRRAARSA
jgi:hypothetical protein